MIDRTVNKKRQITVIDEPQAQQLDNVTQGVIEAQRGAVAIDPEPKAKKGLKQRVSAEEKDANVGENATAAVHIEAPNVIKPKVKRARKRGANIDENAAAAADNEVPIVIKPKARRVRKKDASVDETATAAADVEAPNVVEPKVKKARKKNSNGDENIVAAASVTAPITKAERARKNRVTVEENIVALKAFIEKHQSFPRAHGSREENENRLACFLVNQRGKKTKSKLSQLDIERMESIPGFEWSGFASNFDFLKTVDSIKDFVSRHGYLPKRNRNGLRNEGVEKKLGEFIHTQRKAKHDGELSDERIRAMESIPLFFWSAFDRGLVEDSVFALTSFVHEYNELPRGNGGRPNEKRLNNFVSKQKEYKRIRERNGLPPDDARDALLNTVPLLNWIEVSSSSSHFAAVARRPRRGGAGTAKGLGHVEEDVKFAFA